MSDKKTPSKHSDAKLSTKSESPVVDGATRTEVPASETQSADESTSNPPANPASSPAANLTATSMATDDESDAHPRNDDRHGERIESSEPLFNAPPIPKMSATNHTNYQGIQKLLLALLALLLIAAVGWSSYSQYQLNHSWNNFKAAQLTLAQQQSQQLETASQNAANGLQMATTTQQSQQSQTVLLNQLSESLTQTQQKVRSLSGRQKQDWLLAEAEYLVNLAQLKLNLERDVATAMLLLKTANERVMLTADNSLLELRQAIAADIAVLGQLQKVDTVGIVSRLNSLTQLVGDLTIKALELELPNTSKTMLDKPDGDASLASDISWQSVYQKFLDDFVSIKDHNEASEPLMTPSQRGNLNANIQLALQQAQLAVARYEQSLYQLHLDNAINWITHFFVNNEQRQSLFAQLSALKQLNIAPPIDSKLTAIEQIKTINQQRLYQWLDKQQKPAEIPAATTETAQPAEETTQPAVVED